MKRLWIKLPCKRWRVYIGEWKLGLNVWVNFLEQVEVTKWRNVLSSLFNIMLFTFCLPCIESFIELKSSGYVKGSWSRHMTTGDNLWGFDWEILLPLPASADVSRAKLRIYELYKELGNTINSSVIHLFSMSDESFK